MAHCDGKTTLDCHICGKVYARKDNLLNHLARHSGVQMKCEHCNKGFRTANDLYKHKKRLHAQVSLNIFDRENSPGSYLMIANFEKINKNVNKNYCSQPKLKIRQL